MATLSIRVAVSDDLAQLRELMRAAIDTLQSRFLSPEQIVASRAIMGLDTQLIDDGTYFVVEATDRSEANGTAPTEARLAGCGGWSRRRTLYGGDHSPGRDAALLDASREPARVRAMYTHPDFARRGVGRMILTACENAARAEGFRVLELAGTLSGQPLYLAAGYSTIERFEDDRGGVSVPLLRMQKALA